MNYTRYKEIVNKEKTSLHYFIIVISFMLKMRVSNSHDYS